MGGGASLHCPVGVRAYRVITPSGGFVGGEPGSLEVCAHLVITPSGGIMDGRASLHCPVTSGYNP